MYRHFASKQELVLAFLLRREEVWTRDWLQAEVRRRASDPRERLLAIFDVFDGWFRSPDFEGCSFINVMLEHPDPTNPVHRAAAKHLARIRLFLAELADEAGIGDPDGFARQWHILMKGSIVAAGEGDREAARRAKQVAAGSAPSAGLDTASTPVVGSVGRAERETGQSRRSGPSASPPEPDARHRGGLQFPRGEDCRCPSPPNSSDPCRGR